MSKGTSCPAKSGESNVQEAESSWTLAVESFIYISLPVSIIPEAMKFMVFYEVFGDSAMPKLKSTLIVQIC